MSFINTHGNGSLDRAYPGGDCGNTLEIQAGKFTRADRILCGDRTWYFNPTTGDDSSETPEDPATPLRTIMEGARRSGRFIRLGTAKLIFSLAAGTYYEYVNMSFYLYYDYIRLVGASQSTTTISGAVRAYYPGRLDLENLTVVQNTTVAPGVNFIVQTVLLGYCDLQNVTLQQNGATAVHACNAGQSSYLRSNDITYVGGNFLSLVSAQSGAICDAAGNQTADDVTVVLGTARANIGGYIYANNDRTQPTTWFGTVTGPRYEATTNGVIVTSGGGETFYPGTTAGIINTGGQYA